MTATPVRNKKGQRIGAKGDRMRQSLMDATAHLLASQPIWLIKVSDIASACGARAPGFYAYFDSVEEVILTLAEQANAARPDLYTVRADKLLLEVAVRRELGRARRVELRQARRCGLLHAALRGVA